MLNRFHASILVSVPSLKSQLQRDAAVLKIAHYVMMTSFWRHVTMLNRFRAPILVSVPSLKSQLQREVSFLKLAHYVMMTSFWRHESMLNRFLTPSILPVPSFKSLIQRKFIRAEGRGAEGRGPSRRAEGRGPSIANTPGNPTSPSINRLFYATFISDINIKKKKEA